MLLMVFHKNHLKHRFEIVVDISLGQNVLCIRMHYYNAYVCIRQEAIF